MILPVEVLNILATQALHYCGNTSKLSTGHEHVNVVGLFYVSIYREALSGCRLLPLICVGIEPDPNYLPITSLCRN